MYKTLSDWDNEWRISFDHYQKDIRHAYYINAVINNEYEKILEIAAGSFRDMNRLNELGKNCYGIDFSDYAVEKAKKLFPNFEHKIICGNAFELPFGKNEFEVSYHNGFWGYFSDEDIELLIKEQVRVTEKVLISTVHNKHCQQFFDYFERKKVDDPLFNIRFFTKDEMVGFLSKYCKNIKIIPVGKQKKYYEDDLINIGLYDAKYLRRSFDYHGERLIDCSERLMCIGFLS